MEWNRGGSPESGCPAADEVDDFQFVAVGDGSGGPGGTRDDGAVVLDSDAIGGERESAEKILKGCTGAELWKAVWLAVDEEVHTGYRVQGCDGTRSWRACLGIASQRRMCQSIQPALPMMTSADSMTRA